jgi:hypothetical protein
MKIKPSKEYTIAEIYSERLFPWANCERTVNRWIMRDRTRGNVLQAKITGKGRLTRYYVKGINIKKFVEKYGNILR